LLGRTFTIDETFEGKDRVTVLNYNFWQEEFGGDPSIIGRSISLTGKTYNVIGVMPRGFFFPSHDIQIYVPFGFKPSELVDTRRPHYMSVIARLRPNVSLAQARAEMKGIASRLEQMYPDTNTQMGVRVENFHAMLAVDMKPALLMLFAAVSALFLIVCSNVANLQLGRAAARIREFGIRHALGAGRRRLVRQLMTESLILSFLGGTFGLTLAIGGRLVLLHAVPEAIPPFAELRLDGWVIVFAVAVTLLAPMLFGVVPAMASARSDALRVRGDTALKHRQSIQHLLVSFQVALSVLLVTGAVLLVRSLIRLERIDPGFDPRHAVSISLALPDIRYSNEEQIVRAVQEFERRLLDEPQIERVGTTLTLPLKGFAWSGDATVEARPTGEYERELRHNSVTPGYFNAIGTPVLRGRLFDEFDTAKSPEVTIVNEALEKAYFRGENAVGRRIKFGRPQDQDPWVTVVGVVADAKQDGMDKPARPEEYTPFAQRPNDALTLVVRGIVPPDRLIALARQAVWSVDKDLALTDITPLPQLIRASAGDQRFRTSLLSTFAGTALFLATLGVYGVLSYSATRRLREMGIRRALGAPHRSLYWMMVRDGMRPVLVGAVIGLAGAYAVTQLIVSLLFGVTPADPISYLLTTTTLVATSLFACSIPALKAVRVDPMVVLRWE
jgi:putative ABC transport system permease protein